MQLVTSIDEVDAMIWDVKRKMNDVMVFIMGSREITHRDKLMLMLRYIRGVSNAEIADRMDYPSRASVQKRIKRIVERM